MSFDYGTYSDEGLVKGLAQLNKMFETNPSELIQMEIKNIQDEINARKLKHEKQVKLLQEAIVNYPQNKYGLDA